MEGSKYQENGIIKFAFDAADKIFMDQKRVKMNFFTNGSERRLALPRSSSSNSCHTCEECGEKRRGKNSIINLDENGRVSTSKKKMQDQVEMSNEVDSPSRDYNDFSLNFLAFFIVVLIKIMGFQFNLVISFFTFPIWLSYFSFTFLIFPFQTLGHIRRYSMRKLFKFLGISGTSVTEKAQKSIGKIAIRYAYACFWSSYVFVMLLGLLGLGFVLAGLAVRIIVEKPVQAREILNFDYTKASPVAFVPIMPCSDVGNPSSLVIGKAADEVGERIIPHNRKLRLIISLTVPESDYNRRLGIFQVRVEFLSATGKVTASSSHPCMLRFKSQPIRFVETIIKSASVIAGFKSESQILNIKMDEFTEGLEPTAYLKIMLESRAEYISGAGVPEIYESSLSLLSDMPKLKGLVWNWKRTIFVWISMVLFFVELILILLVFRPLIIPKGRSRILYYVNKEFSPSDIICWNRKRLEDDDDNRV